MRTIPYQSYCRLCARAASQERYRRLAGDDEWYRQQSARLSERQKIVTQQRRRETLEYVQMVIAAMTAKGLSYREIEGIVKIKGASISRWMKSDPRSRVLQWHIDVLTYVATELYQIRAEQRSRTTHHSEYEFFRDLVSHTVHTLRPNAASRTKGNMA